MAALKPSFEVVGLYTVTKELTEEKNGMSSSWAGATAHPPYPLTPIQGRLKPSNQSLPAAEGTPPNPPRDPPLAPGLEEDGLHQGGVGDGGEGAAAALGPGNDTAGTQSRPVKFIVSMDSSLKAEGEKR
ncbi:hypothetical protein NW762_008007 [Fusarium torreyae]|uniref:Uncharacterized protein n=1 Tax=Fusarium torreyae TaxID=1237075 RepID=A0A9W8RZ59_9HYPO|nr:hypothetical protein NW762_008007 [Fusarium torreyae]